MGYPNPRGPGMRSGGPTVGPGGPGLGPGGARTGARGGQGWGQGGHGPPGPPAGYGPGKEFVCKRVPILAVGLF